MLDQQIAAARRIAKQGKDILARLGIDLPPFRGRTYAAPRLLRFRRVWFWRGRLAGEPTVETAPDVTHHCEA